MLQSYIDAWVEELERVVNAYEAAVDEVEQAMDRVEQAGVSVDAGEQLRRDQCLRELDLALESVQQVAALVRAVDTALDDAIDAAQLVIANEQVDLPVEKCEGYANKAPARYAPTIYGVLDVVGVSKPDNSLGPLPDGAILIQGNYRIVRLLHHRPRLNLYLAERNNVQSTNVEGPQLQPLVAIRELVLTGLSPEISKHVERAAFEEFAAPLLFGSPHLPGVGDRLCVENERHYTVMQLRQVRGKQHAIAVSLAELLFHQPRWPAWLDVDTAWEWGIQLCRIVARLHRLGVTLGDLHPATILVDPQGATEWAPVLLVSWPSPSRFWSASPFSRQSVQELATQIFPIANNSFVNAFAAPETFNGLYDERSDVYTLSAILYWLLTRYAPIIASPGEERAKRNAISNGKQEELSQSRGRLVSTCKELIPPHLFNRHIPLALEQVVVRALSPNPGDRYSSVEALLEALASLQIDHRRDIDNH